MRGLSHPELLHAASLLRGVPTAKVVAALRDAPDVDLPAAWRAALAGDEVRRAVDAERAALDRLGARLLTPADPDWPADLPPEGVLRVRGRIPGGRRLAVVGARRADAYGLELAGRVATAAVRRGVTVVSGGALGTDRAAHEAALAGGLTVVVLGSGLAHPSPPSHRRLFDRAAAAGAVVSPFPTDQPPDRWTFPRRNRWIAGLSLGVVAVQAGAASGALHTAAAARELARPVWAAPGPMDSPLHAGGHALIRGGASLLARDDTWTEALPPGEAESAGVASSPEVPQHPEPDFGASLWRASGAEPLPLSRLAAAAGLDVSEAAPTATLLELRGWLRAFPGGRYARAFPLTDPNERR